MKNTTPHPHSLQSTFRHRSPPATIILMITVTPGSNRICPVGVPSRDVILIPCPSGKNSEKSTQTIPAGTRNQPTCINKQLLFLRSSTVIDFKLTPLPKTCRMASTYTLQISGVPKGGGFGVFKPPPPEIPKALQNRDKLNLICENC